MSETGALNDASRTTCIVTEELSGITPSGGIGACAHGLALHLASQGWAVLVLVTAQRSWNVPLAASLPFKVVFLSETVDADGLMTQPVEQISKSYAAYRFIRGQSFDVVHFNDWLGTGFYTAMARRQGLIASVVVSHLHGSSEWVRLHNLNIPTIASLECEAIERSQIETSDLVICPSRYLVDWYKSRGIKIRRYEVLPWMLPQWFSQAHDANALKTNGIKADQIKTIIFFGRQERRKGFELFVDAIQQLSSEWTPNIIFLGRFDLIDREFTGSYVLRKLKNYKGTIDFLNELNQSESLRLIAQHHDALCVMPSIIENSPCVVGECFTLKVPFITTKVGGTGELVHPQSQRHCMCEAKPAALAELLLKSKRRGVPSVTSTLTPATIFARWRSVDWFISETPAAAVSDRSPLVSICLVHHERPELLLKAVDRIAQQSYSNIELIIVDDGSKSAAALDALTSVENTFKRCPLTVVRSGNNYLGAARNLAASHAQGEYLLFHDDDNLAAPEEVATFVKSALLSGADILTAMCFTFEGTQDDDPAHQRIEYFPIGIGGPYSFFRNRFGDANALVKRAVFEDLAGFTEEYGVGWEDWEFFLRAYLKGYLVSIVPEPIFYYKVSSGGMLGSTSILRNRERIFSLIDELRPSVGADIFRLAQSNHLSQELLDRTWAIISREPGAELHQNLTSLDPNSLNARDLLADLAALLGRESDAARIGFRSGKHRAVNEEGGHAWRLKPKSYSIPPSDQRGFVYVKGWGVKADKTPCVVRDVRINERWYSSIGESRMARVDVKNHLHLPSGEGVGFECFLKEAPRRGKLKGWPGIGRRLTRWPVSPFAAAVRGSFEIGHDAAGSLGHVDAINFLQGSELNLEASGDKWVHIEVATDEGVQPIAISLQAEILFGRSVGPGRILFHIGPAHLRKGLRPLLLTPSHLRCSVSVY